MTRLFGPISPSLREQETPQTIRKAPCGSPASQPATSRLSPQRCPARLRTAGGARPGRDGAEARPEPSGAVLPAGGRGAQV
ncbi:hypothetical protein AV530_005174 [Patagioenas fasciata monilis]|uniref:Uncharacterized protein n=1 Tax=Patagioenas fasciata monilis TaxID=372326 RepID=A0A1V4K4D8_PATFA|nr:hypothetical protein AV530_005174 [Patagioenas fasciata monilis]